jgi:hypothetical protein
MTIEDRVRRVLTDAVADEPPPRGAPLDHALRRHRRRPVLVGVTAMALVVAVIAGVLVARRSDRPAVSPTDGWTSHTQGDLRFRYPPGWRLRPGEDGRSEVVLVPPEDADRPLERVQTTIWVGRHQSFWVGESWQGITRRGRLPGGQAYLYTADDPARPTLGGQAPAPVGEQPRHALYSIDWGRPCLGAAERCVPWRTAVAINVRNGRLWDRYHRVADLIAMSVEQLRPAAPSVGDRSLPACRPNQWRLVWTEEYGGWYEVPRLAIQGGIRYRHGPRCHLRLTLRMVVEDGNGKRLPVRGNPASTTVEGDLPVDGLQRFSGSWVIEGALMWRFVWDEWCNRGLPQATLRVAADGGASLTVPGLDPDRPVPRSQAPPRSGCGNRGRPSVVAGWP